MLFPKSIESRVGLYDWHDLCGTYSIEGPGSEGRQEVDNYLWNTYYIPQMITF